MPCSTSITDGQIYLQSDLFNAGQRPALNVGISVSRVGGDAQTKAMRQVAGQLRLDLAQYRELAAFAQFASDLDTQTRNQLERGARLTELLKQDKYQPVPLAEQVAVIYAGTQGHLDKVPVARVREWEAGFVRFLRSDQAALLAEIEKKQALDDGIFERLKSAIATYNHQFGVEGDTGGKATEARKPGAKGEPKAQAPVAKADPKAQAPAAQVEPKAQAPAAQEEPSTEAPAAKVEPKAQGAPAAKVEPKAQAPAAQEEPSTEAPAAKVEPKAQGAPAAKVEPKAKAPAKDETEERPSQLNQIRAVLADPPAEEAPKAEPPASEPKPRPARKPRAAK